MSTLLASFVLGLVKGLAQPTDDGFSLERDVWGPTKEEIVYRGLPLWTFPRLPYGSTAVLFAVDHVLDDMKQDAGMTAAQVAARFGDVFLGGLFYEGAMRRNGLASAVASHALHNCAVSVGAMLRRRA